MLPVSANLRGPHPPQADLCECSVFLSCAGLPDDTIARILMTADASQKHMLSRWEFFLALRLVSMTQRGEPLNSEAAKYTAVPLANLPDAHLAQHSVKVACARSALLRAQSRATSSSHERDEEVAQVMSRIQALRAAQGAAAGGGAVDGDLGQGVAALDSCRTESAPLDAAAVRDAQSKVAVTPLAQALPMETRQHIGSIVSTILAASKRIAAALRSGDGASTPLLAIPDSVAGGRLCVHCCKHLHLRCARRSGALVQESPALAARCIEQPVAFYLESLQRTRWCSG